MESPRVCITCFKVSEEKLSGTDSLILLFNIISMGLYKVALGDIFIGNCWKLVSDSDLSNLLFHWLKVQ
jgi:hypothetical protein